MATDRLSKAKPAPKDLWIVVICLAVSAFAMLRDSPFILFIRDVLGVPRTGDSAQRYLQGYVADGASAAIGLVLVLLFLACTWRQYPNGSAYAVVPCCCILIFPIVSAIDILWQCLNLMDDPVKADAVYDIQGTHRMGHVALYSGFAMSFLILTAGWAGTGLPKWAQGRSAVHRQS